MFLRSGFPFNYDTNGDGDASGLCCEDKSRALQSAAEECDINTIVRRFHLTGQLPENVRAPVFGDFDGVFDYQSAMNAVRAAQESFMAMPPEVRARFGNDPGELVAFCSDEANRSEAEKLGLLVPPLEAEGPQAPTGAPAPKPVETGVSGVEKPSVAQ